MWSFIVFCNTLCCIVFNRNVVCFYAIQAGREVRIMVAPEEVDDNGLVLLARDVTKRIENDLEYPGQIKVSIIRETRATEYAK